MNGKEIRNVLKDSLDEFEEREYLGMSAISKCPRFLYDGLVNGRAAPSLLGKRYFHEGYLHERDVVARLVERGATVTNCQREVVAPFDGRFRGHIDGELDGGLLLEIKSINDDGFARVMDEGPLPDHVDQVQMYMRYGGYSRAILIYKCRNDGDIWTEEVALDEALGAALERKAQAVLEAVDRREPPRCTCGKCR